MRWDQPITRTVAVFGGNPIVGCRLRLPTAFNHEAGTKRTGAKRHTATGASEKLPGILVPGTHYHTRKQRPRRPRNQLAYRGELLILPVGKHGFPPGSTAPGRPQEELDILWLTARRLGCDGDTIAMAAATQPGIEELVLSAIPWSRFTSRSRSL